MGTNQHDFINRLRSLFNIDGYKLPELSWRQQHNFVCDPVRYFIQADDEQQAAIWREVEKRQSVGTFAGIPIDDLARSSPIAGWHPGDDA